MNGPFPLSGPLRVLLVEDSPLLGAVLGDVIRELEGVAMEGRADGESVAMARMEAGGVELVIVDLELRQGSGFGVLRQLQSAPERYGRPRVIVFSSFSHPAVQQRCAALGAEAFFDKAMGVDALLDFIQDAATGARGD